VEVSLVRKQLRTAIDTARARARDRREWAADAERDYGHFLEHVATPLVRQLAGALKAEGYTFTVFTPGHGLRLASERTRDDFIEIGLDTTADPPAVTGRVSRTRGSRTIEEERAVKPGTPPGALTEEDLLAFLLPALEPWLER
jgi:hypothetical protein